MRVGPKVNGKDGIERAGSRQRSPALSAAVFDSGPASRRAAAGQSGAHPEDADALERIPTEDTETPTIQG
jgi:hypothetical protein